MMSSPPSVKISDSERRSGIISSDGTSFRRTCRSVSTKDRCRAACPSVSGGRPMRGVVSWKGLPLLAAVMRSKGSSQAWYASENLPICAGSRARAPSSSAARAASSGVMWMRLQRSLYWPQSSRARSTPSGLFSQIGKVRAVSAVSAEKKPFFPEIPAEIRPRDFCCGSDCGRNNDALWSHGHEIPDSGERHRPSPLQNTVFREAPAAEMGADAQTAERRRRFCPSVPMMLG